MVAKQTEKTIYRTADKNTQNTVNETSLLVNSVRVLNGAGVRFQLVKRTTCSTRRNERRRQCTPGLQYMSRQYSQGHSRSFRGL